MLAGDLLEDARYLEAAGDSEKRLSCMRRAVSTAYYAIFHLLVADFVEHWEFEDQRARLARMFDRKKRCAMPHLPARTSEILRLSNSRLSR